MTRRDPRTRSPRRRAAVGTASARPWLASLAVVGVTAGVGLAPAYAVADGGESMAQAAASAISIAVADAPAVDTGTVTVTDDGSGPRRDGDALPGLSVLGSQTLLATGVLVQDGLAEVTADDATSAACAGLAGDGATVVSLGPQGCLEPAGDLLAGITSLDLSGLELGDVTAPVSTLLTDELTDVLGGLLTPLQDVLDQVTPAVQDAVDQVGGGLGDLDLGLRLRAVEATCLADTSVAAGAARLTDVSVVATLDQLGEIVLLTLPTAPQPDTDLLVDLDEVATLLLDAIATDLETSLAGLAADLTVLTTAVQQQVVDTVLAEVAPQLAPLSENLLRVTLNRQSAPADGALEVTALAAEVLPVAATLGGFRTLADVAIGSVGCGPNLRAAAPTGGEDGGDPPAEDGGDPPGSPAAGPDVPTSVSAGSAALPAIPSRVGSGPAVAASPGVALSSASTTASTTAAAGSFAATSLLLAGLWLMLRRREARAGRAG